MKNYLNKIIAVLFVLSILFVCGSLVKRSITIKSSPAYDTSNFVVIGTQVPGGKVLAESLNTGEKIEGKHSATLTNGQLVAVRYTYKILPKEGGILGGRKTIVTNILQVEFVPIDPAERHR
ncbi:MAG: hypothetical protein A2836_01400 [Candidatus Taylorbacteria bacterium RIFCSPHIGHO2_01_FULL_45_63]|uniref:Uncharacterized protein n=1 Tax=Candidatus Taylorbacteria bacterium RIFCSPHIGHO2_02_FULL_45_35 TaxID=1802311 RepID=A0A1G2MW26_9BACT|nr:MAG: hypothetical protein A2836_01400 [Candidatus Taylorbacteria bacterium RIFCSPHIGHO2_01_FULL_45_63]OHA28067.1 MAG: hypothetical protein A3D56_00105 [Candidatus Taylorbacteria bacterium RIFCSPHIGHO2_02_FULL_45_35]OHA34892.1 MAG: hypothetical protein A3A22_02900 [Candidatus Taylorbacteria bacterium RIFCSPLOWO2_01_FULL_45_34b]